MSQLSLSGKFVRHIIDGAEILVPIKQAVKELAEFLYIRAGSFGKHPQRLQIGGAFDANKYMYYGTKDIDLDAAPFSDSDIGKAFTFIECGEISYWGYDGFESDGVTPAISRFTISAEEGSCSVLMLIDRVEDENIFQLVNTSTGVAPNPPTPKFSVTVVNGITNKATAMEDEIVTISPLSLFIDPRDDKVYGFKTMPDGKNWMVENFDYAQSGSWYYNNNLSSPPFTKAGRLYTWDQAIAAVPDGWHLPTDAEWAALALAVGGTGTYGENGNANILKAISGWSGNGNGIDEFGFAALPGGNRVASSGNFEGLGYGALFWTATADGANNAFRRTMSYDSDNIDRSSRGKGYGFSVRLVKNV